jgi:predicted aspartyl protease
MGLTKVTVAVMPLSKSRKRYEDLFLVDTGAIDCLAPRRELLKAGIKVEGRQVYELANGETVEYEYGFARLTFMGAETVAPIIMGPDDAEPLLGAVALESAGLSMDPATRTPKKMPAKPLK